MKPAPNELIEIYRQKVAGARTASAGNNGAFKIPFGKVILNIIASDGGSWDHVSVSLPDRCPTWEEMCHIKDLFFRTDEWVIQLHPPKSANINNHRYCLHLWRAQEGAQPIPPVWMVGWKGMTHEQVAAMTYEQKLQMQDKLARKLGLPV